MTTSTALIQQFSTISAFRACRDGLSSETTVAFVPTMGALHEGHLSLIRLAKQYADQVVVSIFVNPLQFSANEDFGQYPRTLEADLAQCQSIGVDAIFAPTATEMYPEDSSKALPKTPSKTLVVPPSTLTECFCGLTRPGHFTGVATVVAKLFHIVQPDFAVFGEKDAQQLAVIRWMVKDLNFPIQIIEHPTVREESGLAMSSRNRYLKLDAEKEAALILSKTLLAIRNSAQSGEPVQSLLDSSLQNAIASVSTEAQVLFQLEYLAAVDAETFLPVTQFKPTTRLLMAASVGAVRLIDNSLI